MKATMTHEDVVRANQLADKEPNGLILPRSPAIAHQYDPYNEMADVVPVTVRNAALLLRVATEARDKAVDVAIDAKKAYDAAAAARDAAKREVERAEYRLKLSAMQPNGGEE